MTFSVGDRVRVTTSVGPFKKGDEAVLIYQDTEFSSYPYRAETVNGEMDCPVRESEIEALEPTPAPNHTRPFATCKACNPDTGKEGTPPVAETTEKRRQVVHNDYEPGEDSIFEVVAEDGDELWVRYVYGRYGATGDGGRYTIPAAEYKTYVPVPVKGEQYQAKFGAGKVTVRGVVEGAVVYDWYQTSGDYDDPYCRSVSNFLDGFQKVDDDG